MRAEEIEQNILSLVLAMIRANGVAVDCMEPLVLMAKLKRTSEGRGGGTHQLDAVSPARNTTAQNAGRHPLDTAQPGWTPASGNASGICRVLGYRNMNPDRQSCSTEKNDSRRL